MMLRAGGDGGYSLGMLGLSGCIPGLEFAVSDSFVELLAFFECLLEHYDSGVLAHVVVADVLHDRQHRACACEECAAHFLDLGWSGVGWHYRVCEGLPFIIRLLVGMWFFGSRCLFG